MILFCPHQIFRNLHYQLIYPFSFTGLDYAGQIYLKNVYKDSKMYEAWMFFLICASTCNIYLGIVPE